ncbi:HrpB1 family type III secretion system apparatus protein [Trinickia sp. LjRoot230]|uniref:HrpB1 family type III secretion system apparatus protein n=1 Tax=Trinickia sp. LjRoot230 TaxID=3342288 RepID=UPI003ED13E8E
MVDIRCNAVVLNFLLTIFAGGLRVQAHAEAEELLLALRLLHPNQLVADLCEVRLLVNAQRWVEALRLLRQIEAQGNGSPVVSALEGWCLHVMGDEGWRRCIADVLKSSDVTGITIASKFLQVTDEPLAEGIAQKVGADYL